MNWPGRFFTADPIRQFEVADSTPAVVQIHDDVPPHGVTGLQFERTDRSRCKGQFVYGPVRMDPYRGMDFGAVFQFSC